MNEHTTNHNPSVEHHRVVAELLHKAAEAHNNAANAHEIGNPDLAANHAAQAHAHLAEALANIEVAKKHHA